MWYRDAIPIGIPQFDGLSTGPPGIWGVRMGEAKVILGVKITRMGIMLSQ